MDRHVVLERDGDAGESARIVATSQRLGYPIGQLASALDVRIQVGMHFEIAFLEAGDGLFRDVLRVEFARANPRSDGGCRKHGQMSSSPGSAS